MPRPWRPFLAAGAFAVLALWLALILRHAPEPAIYPDSNEYVEAARSFLRTGGFPELSGRTPGYPLLLALVFLFGGMDNVTAAAMAQHIMLWAYAPLLAWILWRATGRAAAAVIAAFIAGLSYSSLQYSATILSEVPSGFFFLLALALFQKFFLNESFNVGEVNVGEVNVGGAVPAATTQNWLLAAATLAVILMSLMRAAFFFLPFVFVSGLLLGRWLLIKFSPTPAPLAPLPRCALAWFTAAAALAVLGWCLHNALHFSTFGVTATMGGNLTNHTFPYIEDIEPESHNQSLLIAIMARARDQNRDRHGGQGEMAVWMEMDVMRRATGLTKEQICREFMRLNRRLILAHPAEYMQSVGYAWRSYWSQATYAYSPRPIHAAVIMHTGAPERLYRAVNQRWLGAAWFRDYYEWKFLAAVMLLMAFYQRRPAAFILFLIIGLAAWSEAIVTSLVEYGENYRYRASHEPILIGVVVFAMIEAISRIFERMRGGTPSPAPQTQEAVAPDA